MQTELEDVLAESVIVGEVRMGDAVEAVLEKDGEKERVVTKKFTKMYSKLQAVIVYL